MSFDITVIEFPATHLIGMKVRTNMKNAQKDCPAIWQTFGPRIIEIPGGDCVGKGAYGVSVMFNENDFDYWAAVESQTESPLPDGMDTIDIPTGLYAKCTVAGLEKLGEAYTFVYGPWIQGQNEYALDMSGMSFELYPNNWNPNKTLEIYAPVKKTS